MRWCHFLASRNLGGPFLRLFSASISTSPLDIKNLQPKGRFKPRRGPKLKWGKRPVPDPDGVAQVLEALASHCDPFIAERNWLLGRTAYETGLRAMGLTSLSCGTIEAMLQGDRIIGPIDRIDLFATDRARKAEIRSSLDRLIKSGRENLFASVTEKGGKTRTVAFPIELVLALCEHIWGERHALILTRRGGRGAKSSRHLWLSKNNLSQLERSSVKDILRMRGFVAAGVKGSGHSLRAVFLTEYARRLLREAKNRFGQSYDAHALLVMLAEIAGHEDPVTLKNYLDEARIREALTGDRQFLKRP
jgi:integrase